MSLSEQVRRTIAEHGPMSEMDLACWLDVSYLQVRGAALVLIRKGVCRWFRGRLTLRQVRPIVPNPTFLQL